MKIGCISWSYRNEFNETQYDMFRWIRHCAEDVHLDGVELWNNHFVSLQPYYLDRISAACKENGLQLYSVASKCLYGQFTPSEVAAAQDTLREWLVATDHLGAPLLRISVGGKELRDPARQAIVFQSLADVVSEGRYPHIQVGIENQEPGVVQNVDDVIAMDQATQGRLKLVLDNGSIIDKSTVYDFMERTIPYAAVIHLKFFDIDASGADRVLDYSRIVPIIKNSGYNGFVSIEYDSSRPASQDVPCIARFLKAQFQER
jgi:sugar phosphate isomerase/epimerase